MHLQRNRSQLTDAGIKAREEGHRREELLDERVRELLGSQLSDKLERLLDQARERLTDSASAEDDRARIEASTTRR